MLATMLLSAALYTQAQDANRAPAFRPRLNVRIQPAGRNALAAQRAVEQREIVCGMVVVHKTPADDPKIILPARETGAKIRRIEPKVCGATQIVPAK